MSSSNNRALNLDVKNILPVRSRDMLLQGVINSITSSDLPTRQAAK